MNNKKLTKRASGLCLALMAGFFVLCTNTIGFGQTVDHQASCFTLTPSTSQTAFCGFVTDDRDCPSCDEHCASFDFTNISTNCDITSLTIEAIGTTGTNPTVASACWSTCSAQGASSDPSCSAGAKTYTGHYVPGGTNTLPTAITICYKGAGPHYFKLTMAGSKFNPGGIDDCCPADPARVHF